MKELVREWYRNFLRQVRPAKRADPLREAALKRRMGEWTRHLTEVVVETCRAMGWTAVGRGHLGEFLPVAKQEYLSLDVMAFADDEAVSWPLPVAVFELENQEREELIAYSLWKVCLIRCPMKVMFCYRRNSPEIGDLLKSLASGVMNGIYPQGKEKQSVLVVVGTRSQAEKFPDGFFRPYFWDGNVQMFRPLL